MQRERNSLESFPETVDLNQGSFPSNNTSMEHSTSWDNNMANPVENRLSNYMLAPNDSNINRINATENHAQFFNGWDRGASSSSANNPQERAFVDDSKTRLGWHPSWSFAPSSTTNTSSSHGHVIENDCHISLEAGPSRIHYNSGYSETNQIPTFYDSSSNRGNSSDSSFPFLENNDWGSSCKRKAIEGTSRQFYPGSSSSSSQPRDNTMTPNLSISSSGSLNLSRTNHSEGLHISSGVGMNRVGPSFSPPSNVPRFVEGSTRNFIPNVGSSDFRSTMTRPIINPNNTINQPHSMNRNEARARPLYHYDQSLSSRGGTSSSSFMVREEVNARNVSNDQIDWSFAPVTSVSSRNHSSSGSIMGPASGGPAWLPHQIHTSQYHQRLSEAAPWIPLSTIESDFPIPRNHFPVLPSGSSSSDGVAGPSRAEHGTDHRSAPVLMDMPGDNNDYALRIMAAVEERHRLVRHVLRTMRRGIPLLAEDYVIMEPLSIGFADLHDRHRDLRLDVDNMSYEELLALEERIGDVNTGLTEDKIRGSMNQRKYEGTRASPNTEPCCICQENYIAGNEIGILDCGHEFHSDCIKQWLLLKNLCPICKMTALNA
ncbi:hypothetical protein ACJIZ3_015510 [Penstemon smallii]|uniref:RING-type E3 ubiquitin transferase n=1 Tax=Penstemon smallii TaxID=265156 RepID=A0ABD3RMP2_9LAMI